MMQRSRHFAVLFALALTSAGCNSSFFSGDKEEKDDEDATEEGATDQEATGGNLETAVPPVNITGTYLACAYIKEATVDDPNADVGCLIKNTEDKSKANLATLADKWTWTYYLPATAAGQADITVTDLRDDDPAWHAIYAFRAATLAAVTQVLQEVRIQVPMVLKGDKEESLPFDQPVSEPLQKDVTTPAVPETPADATKSPPV